jgi:phospholipase C
VRKPGGPAAIAVEVLVGLSVLFGGFADAAESAEAQITGATPIEHVVIIYQENHSFDNVLGKLCVADSRCNGARTGKLPDGRTITLTQPRDLVPGVDHLTAGQRTAINGGKMDGFGNLSGCREQNNWQCYKEFAPSQIPNLAALAREFTISDRTFSMNPVPSFGAHVELVAQTLDGFYDIPVAGSGPPGNGWGCDSGKDVKWRSSSGALQLVPSCVPDFTLDPVLFPFGGAYRATPVQHVPTIMDRLGEAGRSWKIYAVPEGTGAGYSWAICPTFAGCLYTSQHNNQVATNEVFTDAQAGNLPNFSIVIPTWKNSQHNTASMLQGDNWIGSVVSAIQNSPQWSSTAIFITYDDCGCFYDHVPPPAGLGIRVPMVIVSPYAKPGYTDSSRASFSSMLAFAEHVFELNPLTQRDANAYDFANSFDFTAPPSLATTHLKSSVIPAWEVRWMRTHRGDDPAHDPT